MILGAASASSCVADHTQEHVLWHGHDMLCTHALRCTGSEMQTQRQVDTLGDSSHRTNADGRFYVGVIKIFTQQCCLQCWFLEPFL